eukprot:1143296-Rhodomonas_salina.2
MYGIRDLVQVYSGRRGTYATCRYLVPTTLPQYRVGSSHTARQYRTSRSKCLGWWALRYGGTGHRVAARRQIGS